MPISLLPYVFTITVIMLCATPVQSRWCTRLVTYTTTKPYVKQSMCNQSYEESCSFFSFQMCTRYELVPCMKEENKTVTMYKIFESCCPGYRLNPLNNLTCEEIETDNGKEAREKVTTTQYPNARVAQPSPSQVKTKTDLATAHETKTDLSMARETAVSDQDPGPRSAARPVDSGKDRKTFVIPDHGMRPPAQGTQTSANKDGENKSAGYENFDGRVEFYQTESDGKLFGMTKGAYAGIVCSVVFLLCVVVLVSIRLYKRQRKNRLKAQKKQQVELEASQKMMSDTEAKSVA
ncbi:hypothetical protein RRG08_001899 [Elysia crispata]|uniref:EMI domain-containing protein n=1 Tax=Elysia crispata TaxID=231223 RepID=A0AAE1ABZ4_9GAST|nr:hypothetical protein RRG08_001899 [Elysia crispata]